MRTPRPCAAEACGAAWLRSQGRGRAVRLAAAAACMLAATPAPAQWRHVFPEDFTLAQDDIDRMRDARNQLLAVDPPAVGRSATWSSPRSGAHGTIILEGVSEVQGMPCRRLRYVIVPRGASSAIDVAERICRTPDGSWKFQ